MKRTHVVLLLAACIGIAQVAPAFGAPSLASLVRRLRSVDAREQLHYLSTNRRLNAAAQLLTTQKIGNDVQSSSMTQDGRFFQGSATCPTGTLVGGGVDWGSSPMLGDYHVVSSAPDILGSSWHATLNVGSAPGPSVFPRVYAICASIR